MWIGEGPGAGANSQLSDGLDNQMWTHAREVQTRFSTTSLSRQYKPVEHDGAVMKQPRSEVIPEVEGVARRRCARPEAR
jgi:hypothetical protein